MILLVNTSRSGGTGGYFYCSSIDMDFVFPLHLCFSSRSSLPTPFPSIACWARDGGATEYDTNVAGDLLADYVERGGKVVVCYTNPAVSRKEGDREASIFEIYARCVQRYVCRILYRFLTCLRVSQIMTEQNNLNKKQPLPKTPDQNPTINTLLLCSLQAAGHLWPQCIKGVCFP